MIPESLTQFFLAYQNALWVLTVAFDLAITLLMYRLFGKMGLYAVVILNIMLSNLQGPKLTVIFGLETSLGLILYSGIYFATDILSERYGKREGTRAVLLGFATSVIMVIMMSLSLLFLPSKPFAETIHEAITTLFDFTPLFVFGSLFVYLVSQSFDVWLFHYIKQKTRGRHLWLRNNVSTITSQAVDTILYALVVWTPIVGLKMAIELSLAKYLFKVIVALLDTPFIYWACSWDVSKRDWHETRPVSYEDYHWENELTAKSAAKTATTTPCPELNKNATSSPLNKSSDPPQN
ncbi:queuosine precursor transporter [Thioflexithrix psekupsensis]|uniref:Probable queuosine precursor transporter n=1 Tax=Thioflexithrix psekupsensis TaxID=1570016 RepID=A0A251X5P8_9GAMM|nr:queuosine precursor transporter [Thioflexithrix psekupsensis]OUD13066.1 hypothetical protein TPSD3_10465 [Thioflexithrix psekupsensis]